MESPDFSAELARQAIAELKQLRPYFQGDFYALLPLTVSQADWHAYQLDRPDLGEGCVLVFRRPESADAQRQIKLAAIDPQATYDVSVMGETYIPASPRRIFGQELAQPTIRIDAQPGSTLLRYKRSQR